MILTIQFPFSDLRNFSDNRYGLLSLPTWPNPNSDGEFVRALGGVIQSEKNWASGWIAEQRQVAATRGIQFHRFPSIADATGRHFQFRIVGRRFYFDGLCMGKMEIDFALIQDQSRFQGDMDAVLDHILSLKMAIRRHYAPISKERVERFDEFVLGTEYSFLARAIAARTVSRDFVRQVAETSKLIRVGRPLIYVSLEGDDATISIPPTKFVELNNQKARYIRNLSIAVFHGRRTLPPRREVPIWIARYLGPIVDRDKYNFKTFLLRLHAEHECLGYVLKQIQIGKLEPSPESEQFKALQEYLTNANRRVLKLGRKFSPVDFNSSYPSDGAEKWETIEALAQLSIDDFKPGDKEQLTAQLRKISIKSHCVANIEKYVDRDLEARASRGNIYFYGAVDMSNKSQNLTVESSQGVSITQAGRDATAKNDQVFNQIRETKSKETLVEQLGQLKDLLNKANNIGGVQPESLSRDYESFAREAVASSPRKNRLTDIGKAILEGLTPAIELVGDVAKLVESVIALF